MLKKLVIISALAVYAFALHQGELNINDKDLELSAALDMGQFNDAVEPDTMFVGGKFLNADDGHSLDANQKIEPYYEANFLIMKEIGDKGMYFGMGAKFNYTKQFTSLPLGLEFAYKIPATKLIPMYLNGSIYYAPEALSFSDAKEFMEYRMSYDVELIKNTAITVGYRNINTQYKNASTSVNYNSSWYFGFKVGF